MAHESRDSKGSQTADEQAENMAGFSLDGLAADVAAMTDPAKIKRILKSLADMAYTKAVLDGDHFEYVFSEGLKVGYGRGYKRGYNEALAAGLPANGGVEH